MYAGLDSGPLTTTTYTVNQVDNAVRVSDRAQPSRLNGVSQCQQTMLDAVFPSRNSFRSRCARPAFVEDLLVEEVPVAMLSLLMFPVTPCWLFAGSSKRRGK